MPPGIPSDDLLLQVWADDGGRNADIEGYAFSGLPTQPADGQSPSRDPGKPASSLNSKVPRGVPSAPTLALIYQALTAHQQAEQAWRFHGLASFCHDWWDRCNEAFRLAIPKTALRLEWNLRRNCLGYFNPAHNEFGVVYEIALSIRPHVIDEAAFLLKLLHGDTDLLDLMNQGELAGTITHEQLHLHQQLHGTPGTGNYHNKQFRDRADRLGLIVTPEGYQAYQADGPFQDLLRRHGIEPPRVLPEGQEPQKVVTSTGSSKLKKWVCQCPFNVRVARGDFRAMCLHCRSEFVLGH